MTAYYNEFDPYAAQWLRNLIDAGHIPAGDVDERSILDVRADDLRGYRQCHFFAGIGGWPHALRLAGWADDREVWTGSCPCQPLSSAGQRKGHADERHLWPAFYALVAERRPATVFGEQVASKDGREWLAGVRADLEAARYAVGAADLCAAGVGAPHIRQRLWWVADAERHGRRADEPQRHAQGRIAARRDSASCGLADSDGGHARAERQQRSGQYGRKPQDVSPLAIYREFQEYGRMLTDDERCGLGNAAGPGLQGPGTDESAQGSGCPAGQSGLPGEAVDFWSAVDWLPCTDGKARRIEPGLSPLAHGIPGRVGRLRAYGNAITPQVAAEFVSAYMECLGASPPVVA